MNEREKERSVSRAVGGGWKMRDREAHRRRENLSLPVGLMPDYEDVNALVSESQS